MVSIISPCGQYSKVQVWRNSICDTGHCLSPTSGCSNGWPTFGSGLHGVANYICRAFFAFRAFGHSIVLFFRHRHIVCVCDFYMQTYLSHALGFGPCCFQALSIRRYNASSFFNEKAFDLVHREPFPNLLANIPELREGCESRLIQSMTLQRRLKTCRS